MIPMGGWWTRRHIPWHDECIYGAWRPVPYAWLVRYQDGGER